MNLLQIRTQFVKQSGRYDLVKDAISFADNGADFFINDGIRELDLRQETTGTQAWSYHYLSVGDYFVRLQGLRSVEDAWVVSKTTGSRSANLSEKTVRWAMNNASGDTSANETCVAEEVITAKAYTIVQPAGVRRLEITITDANGSISAVTITVVGFNENLNAQTEVITSTGAGFFKSAYHWSSLTSFTVSSLTGNGASDLIKAEYPAFSDSSIPAIFVRLPLGVTAQLAGGSTRDWSSRVDWQFLEQAVQKVSSPGLYDGLLLLPPPDGEYTLRVLTRSFSGSLTSDTDENWWTVNQPGAVIRSALRSLNEIAYVNMERSKAFTGQIERTLNGIDADLADDEEVSDTNQFESSWKEDPL